MATTMEGPTAAGSTVGSPTAAGPTVEGNARPDAREGNARPDARRRTGGTGRALRRWWDGRAGRQLLFEIALIPLGYYFYKWARHFSRDELDVAFDNARHVIRFESSLGIYNESGIQDLALRSHDLVLAANWFYANAHFWVTGLALLLAYVRWPVEYQRLRRGIVSVTVLALVIHVLYPLAPPRMFPEYGFVDTLEVFGPSIYTDSALAGQANQIAAMPSLHFAYAVLVASLFVRAIPSPWRWLVILHPVVTLLTIVVTANHFWLDAVVGGLLIVVVSPLTSPADRPARPALTAAAT